jgi:hypothetical protein
MRHKRGSAEAGRGIGADSGGRWCPEGGCTASGNNADQVGKSCPSSGLTKISGPDKDPAIARRHAVPGSNHKLSF